MLMVVLALPKFGQRELSFWSENKPGKLTFISLYFYGPDAVCTTSQTIKLCRMLQCKGTVKMQQYTAGPIVLGILQFWLLVICKLHSSMQPY